MSDDKLQARIAEERDQVSKTISDIGVYRSVVENIVTLEAEATDKIDLLLGAVPDIGIMMAQLALCKSRGLLTPDEYNWIVNNCMISLQKTKKSVDFNPNYLGGVLDGE